MGRLALTQLADLPAGRVLTEEPGAAEPGTPKGGNKALGPETQRLRSHELKQVCFVLMTALRRILFQREVHKKNNLFAGQNRRVGKGARLRNEFVEWKIRARRLCPPYSSPDNYDAVGLIRLTRFDFTIPQARNARSRSLP